MYSKGISISSLEKVLECYQLSMDDISDRLIEKKHEEDDLDDLIGGLED
jgi:hypothetical protein